MCLTNYFETHICDRNTTLQPFLHCSRTIWVSKTYLRKSYECRTIIARIIGELDLELAHMLHDIRATFVRYLRGTRTICPMKLRTFITSDRFTTLLRPSHEGRAMVARWFCEKMINLEK